MPQPVENYFRPIPRNPVEALRLASVRPLTEPPLINRIMDLLRRQGPATSQELARKIWGAEYSRGDLSRVGNLLRVRKLNKGDVDYQPLYRRRRGDPKGLWIAGPPAPDELDQSVAARLGRLEEKVNQILEELRRRREWQD